MDKKHILDEIDRTAKENNGIPLGELQFSKVTGIKRSDWRGKYWAKFSDAVRELGYEPNKLTLAYDENLLIESVTSLIKEINKFPTYAEFRLKKYNKKSFPSYSAIQRLGEKFVIAEKVISYCKDKPDCQNVIEICKGVLASSKKEEKEINFKEAEPKFGFVYLMKSGRYHKIGRSDCVEKRGYEIGIKLPEELRIIHKIKTDDPSGIEAYWHKRFENKRKSGEWFDLSSSDVKAFRRRTFM